MFEQLEMVTDMLKVPFAIFQEKICVFESQINDSDILSSFSKNFLSIPEEQVVYLNYFRGIIFASIKFSSATNHFLLTTVLFEKNTVDWEESDWKKYIYHIQGAVSLLSITEELPVKESQHSGFSYHHRPNEQLSIDAFSDVQNDFTDNYEFEELFIQSLKEESPLVLSRLVKKLSSVSTSRLAADPLTEEKYRCVALITILTRGAIKNHCPATLSYRLSDHLIRKLDTLQQLNELKSFVHYIITEFSNLIKNHKVSRNSIVVRHTEDFIDRNLYKKITNQFISENVGVHPAYLSSVFKQEKGISLRNYINSKKIDEAKYLLSKTDLTFKEISEALHFSNQSYFCKLFKQETMYTPKEFRLLF